MPRPSRPKPFKATIVAILRGRFLNEWASLSDLNRVLREKGMGTVSEIDLRALGVPLRRSYGKVFRPGLGWIEGNSQNGAKVKAIIVGATEAAVDSSWRFANGR